MSLTPTGGILATNTGEGLASTGLVVRRVTPIPPGRRDAVVAEPWSLVAPELFRVRFDPAGQRVAYTVGARVVVADARDGQTVAVLDAGGHVVDLAWFPGGDRLAVAVGSVGVRLWDMPV